MTSKGLANVTRLNALVISVMDPVYGAKGDGTTDDTTAIQAAMTAAAALLQPCRVWFPPQRNYLSSAVVNCDLPDGSVWDRRGAKITNSHNGVGYDLNPDATAVIPNAGLSEIKRDIAVLGGQHVNTNATKTASVAIQAYMMRMLRLQDIHFGDMTAGGLGFYSAVKFGGADTYRFIDCFSFDNVRHYWHPAAGTIYPAASSALDTIEVEWRGCHMSVAGDEAGVYSENRHTNWHWFGGSVNGAATVAHIRLSDNATLNSRGTHICGTHFEQMGASLPAMLFTAAGGTGFDTVSIDGGALFLSATTGWHGITLARCNNVDIGSVYFNDGSGGSTERGIYVDDNSRNITIRRQASFVNFATGQDVVYQTASNSNYVTFESKIPTSTYPLMSYGGYQFDGSTDYLDTNALTGIADGKKGTLFMIARFAGAASATEVLLSSTGVALEVRRGSTGSLVVVAENAAGTTILSQTLSGLPLAAAGTYSILLSWDLATAGSMRMYVNDLTNTITSTTFTDDTIDYTVAEYSIGAQTGGASKFTGDIYTVWFDPTNNLEFNTVSVRRKFINADGTPVYLGGRGELPTGSVPILFNGYDDYTSWPRNRGSATTTWTENGTPGAVGTALNGQWAPLEDYGIPKTVTADYTVDRTDVAIINNRAATNTLTLPSAASNKGRKLRVLTIQAQQVDSASSNVIPITGGAAGTAILAAGDGNWALLQSDGTGWQIMAS